MINYTKGEWKVGESFGNGTEYPIYNEDGYELARVFTHNGEQLANAQLIASAPDLYEALEDTVDWLALMEANIPHHGHLLGNITKALAKAEVK